MPCLVSVFVLVHKSGGQVTVPRKCALFGEAIGHDHFHWFRKNESGGDSAMVSCAFPSCPRAHVVLQLFGGVKKQLYFHYADSGDADQNEGTEEEMREVIERTSLWRNNEDHEFHWLKMSIPIQCSASAKGGPGMRIDGGAW